MNDDRLRDSLLQRLRPAGQEHLLQFWDELPLDSRRRLAEQIEQLDLAAMERVGRDEAHHEEWATLAARAEPPPAMRLDWRDVAFRREQAIAAGEAALRAGQVAVILVAGGQGTRLGFEYPKGMFPIGPVSGRTLFQVLVDRLQAVSRRYATRIPLLLMTSPATHDETVAYFAEHQHLGLAADDVRFFCQGTMPVIDLATQRILLDSRDSLLLSPDGHGGMLAALARSGLLAESRRLGIEHFFYAQVDNPLVPLCDPLAIGCHLLSGSELTTQVVAKSQPLERVGNVVAVDGRLRMIEYSDLPESAARRTNADGSLRLWAGNIAVHVFAREFLERMAADADSLPFHRAVKQVDSFDPDTGQRHETRALKCERFIFDLLPAARNAIAVEVSRSEAFAPVKNADGAPADTPASAKALMVAQHAAWLRQAGCEIALGTLVEINPLWALDAEEVARKPTPSRIATDTYFV